MFVGFSVLFYYLILALLPFVCVYLFFSLTFCFATLVDSFKLGDLKTCFLNIDRRIEVLNYIFVQYRHENINFWLNNAIIVERNSSDTLYDPYYFLRSGYK